MTSDLFLPSFAMDCREWLVSTPNADGLPEEVGGTPLLAVLSTAVIGTDDLKSATGVLTVGLLDDDDEDGECTAREFTDPDQGPRERRFLVPVPNGSLALLAEFNVSDETDPELTGRIERLMESFHWAA